MNQFEITDTGIVFDPKNPLNYEQWVALGGKISRLNRSAQFLIGDWINYGATRKEFGEKYIDALKATGLDYSTLRQYAHVAGRVEMFTRVNNLSFEHHRKVAALKEPTAQRRWLELAAKAQDKGEPISTRILAKSILAGKLLTSKAIEKAAGGRGIVNHIPFVNRLSAWWKKMKDTGWLETATIEQRRAVKKDLEPIVEIYRQL